ncbi:hypothetical protein ACXZ1K_16915 [Pedobacter sp. PWIIR3]
MKNAFKFGFLAMAISLSVAACSSEKKAEGTDSTMTDSTMMSTDSMSTDSMAMDSSKMDTMKTDSTKM